MKIKVKVKPNARENSVKLLESGIYEVKVSVPPEKGKANKKVIKLLSEFFKTPAYNITILNGETYKEKSIEIKE